MIIGSMMLVAVNSYCRCPGSIPRRCLISSPLLSRNNCAKEMGGGGSQGSVQVVSTDSWSKRRIDDGGAGACWQTVADGW